MIHLSYVVRQTLLFCVTESFTTFLSRNSYITIDDSDIVCC